MITTKTLPQEADKSRGEYKSRRAFDKNEGILMAKNLFHQRGFDAVGIAELTKTLNIKPPSLYAAYGSKAALFEKCVEAYIEERNLPADEILSDTDDIANALNMLLQRAAVVYTQSSIIRGCMVAEGLRANDPTARAISEKYCELSREYIRNYVSHGYPDSANLVSDYIVTTLQGLSAAASSGLSAPRALSVASFAGSAVINLLAE